MKDRLHSAVHLTSAAWLVLAAALACNAHAGLSCYDPSTISGNLVSAVQEEIAKARFDPGPVDGRWGPKTRQALAAYQRSKHIVATGELDPASMRALFGDDAAASKFGLKPNPELPAKEFATDCR